VWEQEVKLSPIGAALMHRYEGYRNRPYLCPAQIWTVGWGRVLYQEQIRLPVVRVGDYQGMIRKEFPLRPEDNRAWTKDEIEELFSEDVASFERGALRLSPNLVGRQGAFDAVVSFAFNAGLGNYQRSTGMNVRCFWGSHATQEICSQVWCKQRKHPLLQ